VDPAPVGSIQLNDVVPQEPNDKDAADQLLYVEHRGLLTTTADAARVPLCDQAHVDGTGEEWATLWQEQDMYIEPKFEIEESQYRQLLPWGICRACESFPLNTGLGGDNMSPRAVLSLSAEAIEALAVLFMLFESLGTWTDVLEFVMIVLLPKSDGGRRPIGLFCTTVRIWWRARICDVRAWEATTALPSIFGGAGMGAQKAAWQAAFFAEAAALTKVEFAEGLVDLVKAFETVPHHVLAAAAAAKGYPIIILRLSLAAYRFPRTIGIDGVYSRIIRATRGITAGAGTATSELRVLLLEMMIELNDRWALTLTVKLYVDDLTLAACGATERIVKLMVEALDFVVDWLEKILLMQVSAKKSQVPASKPSIAVAIEQAVASGKVSATSYAKLLGTDAVGGNRRSTANTVKRLQAFKDTLPRQHQLRKLGVNSAQMVQARGAPAYFYGIENMGASDCAVCNRRDEWHLRPCIRRPRQRHQVLGVGALRILVLRIRACEILQGCAHQDPASQGFAVEGCHWTSGRGHRHVGPHWLDNH